MDSMANSRFIARRILPRSPLWVAALLAGLWLVVEMGPQVPVGMAFLDWSLPIEEVAGPGEQRWRIEELQLGLRWLLGFGAVIWMLWVVSQFVHTILTMRCKGYTTEPWWYVALLFAQKGHVPLQRLPWRPGAEDWPGHTDWGLLWRLLRPRILQIQRGRVPLVSFEAPPAETSVESISFVMEAAMPSAVSLNEPLDPQTDWAALRQVLKPRAQELEHRFPRATMDFPRRINE